MCQILVTGDLASSESQARPNAAEPASIVIIDSNAATCAKTLKCGVLPAEVAQKGALGNEKAAER